MNIDHPIPFWIIRRTDSARLPFQADRYMKTPAGDMLAEGHHTIAGATLSMVRIEVLTWFRSIGVPAACIAADPGDLSHIESWI